MTCIAELADFLLHEFGNGEWTFWISPEELWDVVEHYGGWLRVQWCDSRSCALSQDLTSVGLLDADGEDGILLDGLFPFGSEADARDYCQRMSSGAEGMSAPIEELFGVQGRMSDSSSHTTGTRAYSDSGKRIEPAELWARICAKRERLGIAAKHTLKPEQ